LWALIIVYFNLSSIFKDELGSLFTKQLGCSIIRNVRVLERRATFNKEGKSNSKNLTLTTGHSHSNYMYVCMYVCIEKKWGILESITMGTIMRVLAMCEERETLILEDWANWWGVLEDPRQIWWAKICVLQITISPCHLNSILDCSHGQSLSLLLVLDKFGGVFFLFFEMFELLSMYVLKLVMMNGCYVPSLWLDMHLYFSFTLMNFIKKTWGKTSFLNPALQPFHKWNYDLVFQLETT